MSSTTFRSLSIRNYRLYASGQVVSNTGAWMQRVAQDWLVLSLSGSGTDLGIVTALQFGPTVLFSLWGGALADRYRKNRLLTVTASAMALCALILGLLVESGSVRLWHVYVMAAAIGTVTAFDGPARQSFVSELVGPEHMANAVSLNAASFNLARVTGLTLAGALIAAVGTGWVFLLNAGTMLAVIVALLMIRERELHAPVPIPRGKGQYREAFDYLKTRADLMAVLFVIFFLATFGLNFQITTTLMAVQTFHLGAGTFGLLNAVFALGALVGALVTARRSRIGIALVLISAMAFAVAAMTLSLMPDAVLYAGALFPTGLTVILVATTANATMQLGVEPEMRGRVMSIYTLVFLGGTPIGAPLVGWIGQHIGPRWAVGLGGLISGVAAVVAAYALARAKNLSLRERLLAHSPERVAERFAG